MTRKIFIKSFFIFLFLISFFRLYDNAMNFDSWQYGEWLINYQNGFVRRGLLGELIYLTSAIFNKNFQITFILIISILTIFYYYLNYKLIKNIDLSFLNLFIIFSPLFFVFFIIISKVGIKKEIILYIFYISYLLALSSKNYDYKKNWIFFLLFPLILLIHEGLFFYLPYLFIPLIFLDNGRNSKKILIQISTLLFLSIFMLVILYLHKGNEEFTNVICNSLGDFAPNKCNWWGPIAALKTEISFETGGSYFEGYFNNEIVNSSNQLFYVFNDLKTYFGFSFYVLISFLPIFLFFNFYNLYKKKVLVILLLFCLVFSLPLFHVAQDWSRWLSIHFHLTAFIIFFLQQKVFADVKIDSNFERLNFYFIKKIKYFFIIILFIYATSLHHHHFFHKGVRLELTYIKLFNKIKN